MFLTLALSFLLSHSQYALLNQRPTQGYMRILEWGVVQKHISEFILIQIISLIKWNLLQA